MDSLFDKIQSALKVLELPADASIAEIQEHYHRLQRQYHPDTCTNQRDKEKAHERSAAINQAYETLADYCRNFRFSFTSVEISKNLPPEEWWRKRFGNDPVWCNTEKEKS